MTLRSEVTLWVLVPPCYHGSFLQSNPTFGRPQAWLMTILDFCLARSELQGTGDCWHIAFWRRWHLNKNYHAFNTLERPSSYSRLPPSHTSLLFPSRISPAVVYKKSSALSDIYLPVLAAEVLEWNNTGIIWDRHVSVYFEWECSEDVFNLLIILYLI